NPALLTLVTLFPLDGAAVAFGRAPADPKGRSTALDDAGGTSAVAGRAIAGTVLTDGNDVACAAGGAVTRVSCRAPGAGRARQLNHPPAPPAIAAATPPAIHVAFHALKPRAGAALGLSDGSFRCFSTLLGRTLSPAGMPRAASSAARSASAVA